MGEHTYATEDRGLLRLPSVDGGAAAAEICIHLVTTTVTHLVSNAFGPPPIHWFF